MEETVETFDALCSSIEGSLQTNTALLWVISLCLSFYQHNLKAAFGTFHMVDSAALSERYERVWCPQCSDACVFTWVTVVHPSILSHTCFSTAGPGYTASYPSMHHAKDSIFVMCEIINQPCFSLWESLSFHTLNKTQPAGFRSVFSDLLVWGSLVILTLQVHRAANTITFIFD